MFLVSGQIRHVVEDVVEAGRLGHGPQRERRLHPERDGGDDPQCAQTEPGGVKQLGARPVVVPADVDQCAVGQDHAQVGHRGRQGG